VALLLDPGDSLLGAAREAVLLVGGLCYSPVEERQVFAVPKFSRRDEDEIVEIPHADTAKREKHGDRRAGLVDVKAMQSKNAAKERQQESDAPRALGYLGLLRVVRVVSVDV